MALRKTQGKRRHTRASAAVVASAAALLGFTQVSLGETGGRSLDDLLDIKPSSGGATTRPASETGATPGAGRAAPGGAGSAPIDPSVARRLNGQEMSDLFLSAVKEMGDIAETLGKRQDVSLTTQRAQQAVLDKLDRIIASSQRQQSSSASSSSSGSSGEQSGSPSQSDKGSAGNAAKGGSKPGEGNDKPGNKPGDKNDGNSGNKPGDARDGAAQPGATANQGTNRSPGGAGGSRDASPLESVRKGWGNLPPRVRDELIQAQQEPVAPVYRDMTEEFYRRLAEESR